MNALHLHAGHTSEVHLPARDDDDDDDEDDDDDDDLGLSLVFNLGTINRRRGRETKLIAATLALRKMLTRDDNGICTVNVNTVNKTSCCLVQPLTTLSQNNIRLDA